MDPCARCGHALGIGRYCVNCGHPRGDALGPAPLDDERDERDEVTRTAERPAVRIHDAPTVVPPARSGPAEQPGSAEPGLALPPPVYETPRRPRYPMYADDPAPPPATPSTPIASVAPAVWEAETSVPTTFLGADDASADLDDDHVDRTGHAPRSHAASTTRRALLPWLAVAAALLLVAGMGVFLLLGGTGDDDGSAEDPAPSVSADTSEDPGSSAPPSSQAPTTPQPSTPTTTPGPATDVTATATVEVPATADPGVDVEGNPVSYDAANMLDGRDDTAWRAPGTAAGESIVLTLPELTRLTSVGLLNGYAKTDPGYDGYTANRRVLEVEWTFDDGSRATQVLGDSRSVQRLTVAVETTTVTMRLVSVSEPAPAPQGRDFTAISTVELVGAPAS